MTKLIVNDIEMEIIGIKKGKLILEYIEEYRSGYMDYSIFKKRNPTFKIYKSTKGFYIQGKRRVYVGDAIIEYFNNNFNGIFSFEGIPTETLLKILAERIK